MQKKAQKLNRKEVDAMSTAVKLRAAEVKYIKEMDTYIGKLKKQQMDSREDACREAKNALLRTGVLTNNGKTKKKIVSWE